MVRSGDRWRCLTKVAMGAIAVLGSAFPSLAQTAALPVYDPALVAVLSFRPDSTDTLLLVVADDRHRLQAHLVHLASDGRALLVRTLPEPVTSAAWLDTGHIVTGGGDSRLESWPIEGGGPTILATLPEAISGIGVAPTSRNLVLRLGQTLHLTAPDGRPNGPTITLGLPLKPSDTCPPEGIEPTAAFSPDERLIVFSGLCGDLRVTGREGTRLMHADVPRAYVKRHVFSADGRTLAVTYTAPPGHNPPGGGADFWPVAPGRLGNPRALPGPFEADDPADIAALPGKSSFVVLSSDHLRFLTPDGSLPASDLALSAAKRLAVSSDGTRIVVAAAEGLVLLDGNGQRVVPQPFGDFGVPVAVRAIAGGTQLAALSSDGRLRIWGLDGKEVRESLRIWKIEASSAAGNVHRQTPNLFVSPSGHRVAALAPDGQLEVFDENWKHVGRPVRFPAERGDTASNATLLLDDRILRPMPDGTGFLVLGFDGRVLGRMTFGDQAKIMPEAAVASAGVIAVYASDGRLAAWSIDGRPIRQRKVVGSALSSPKLDISADGKTVALHDIPEHLPPHLLVWKPAEDDSLENRDGTFAGLLADGTLLRVSKSRLVVDAPNGVPRLSLPIEADRVAAVTPDGKFALVALKGAVHAVKIAPQKP